MAPRIDSVPFRDRSFFLPADPGVAMQVLKSQANQTRLSVIPTPSLDEVRDWLVTCDERPSLVPIYREIMADSETPVSAYARIHDGADRVSSSRASRAASESPDTPSSARTRLGQIRTRGRSRDGPSTARRPRTRSTTRSVPASR